jgi:hypothetical protein
VSVLVVASEAEHPGSARVWGTGGWTLPDEREARDWLTLCRLLGWEVRLATRHDAIPRDVRFVLVACEVDERLDAALRGLLHDTPALVVTRRAQRGERCGGTTLRWSGPGAAAAWALDAAVAAECLDSGVPWLTLDEHPVAAARGVGRGTLLELGVHPSALRDAGGGAAIRALLTRGSREPIAWLDLERTLVLRMDDPGGAQNVHLDPFAYRELDGDAWREIGALLRRRSARMSVAAVAGWVDDGDPARGELLGMERAAARVHRSWEVRYRDRRGVLHDYAGEFRALRDLARHGLVDIQLHGHTHMHPDLAGWCRAADRHQATRWYRELAADAHAPPGEHPLARGLDELTAFFAARPTTVVFPGDAWTDAALGRALDLDLALAASYYLALRDGDRFCWCEQVEAPYLDEPAARWFRAGLPVVGYFHARDVSLGGVGWLSDLLARWAEAGAARVIGFGELAFALSCRIDGLTVTAPERRPLRLLWSRGAGAAAVAVGIDDAPIAVRVDGA